MASSSARRTAPSPALHAGLRLPPRVVLAPALVAATLAALPILYLVARALAVEPASLGLVFRPRTAEVLAGSVIAGAGVAVLAIAIGLPLAWLTTRTDLPARRLWSVVTVAPLAIPSYVTAFAFVAAFGPRGAISDLLAAAGLGRPPSIYGLAGAIFVLGLATFPYVTLSCRGALMRSDPELEDAARSLGDSPRTVFQRVTLPLIAPAVAAGALLAVLYALADFGAVSILRADTFARAIYLQYRASFDRELGAVLALVLVALTLAVAWLESRARGRVAALQHDATRRPPRAVALGAWRWPALVFCGLVTVLALILPAATIAVWLLRGLAQGEPVRLLADATTRSLLVGTGAGALALVLAMPVAFLVVRHPGFVSRGVERVLLTAYAVPGIVLALATVFFVLNVVPAVYQTVLVLVIALAVRFLPQAVAPVRAGLATVGPRLVEAARSLGATPLDALRTVTVPLLRPGLAAAAALVFLTTVKELPLTLLLGPPGFDTLATVVWGAANEGFYARAAGPAATLLLLSLAGVALLLRAGDPER